jgi:hypothetical protein
LKSPPFSTRFRDVGTNRSGVDVVIPTLSHCFGESDGHALPDTGSAPTSKAPIDRVPVAVLLRHIAPRRASTQPPQNAVDDVAVVLRRSSSTALARFPLNRQQNSQDTPLDLAQIAAAQGCLIESAALNQHDSCVNRFCPRRLGLDRVGIFVRDVHVPRIAQNISRAARLTAQRPSRPASVISGDF